MCTHSADGRCVDARGCEGGAGLPHAAIRKVATRVAGKRTHDADKRSEVDVSVVTVGWADARDTRPFIRNLCTDTDGGHACERGQARRTHTRTHTHTHTHTHTDSAEVALLCGGGRGGGRNPFTQRANPFCRPPFSTAPKTHPHGRPHTQSRTECWWPQVRSCIPSSSPPRGYP